MRVPVAYRTTAGHDVQPSTRYTTACSGTSCGCTPRCISIRLRNKMKCFLMLRGALHRCSAAAAAPEVSCSRCLLVVLVVADEAVPVLVGGREARVVGGSGDLQQHPQQDNRWGQRPTQMSAGRLQLQQFFSASSDAGANTLLRAIAALLKQVELQANALLHATACYCCTHPVAQ